MNIWFFSMSLNIKCSYYLTFHETGQRRIIPLICEFIEFNIKSHCNLFLKYMHDVSYLFCNYKTHPLSTKTKLKLINLI